MRAGFDRLTMIAALAAVMLVPLTVLFRWWYAPQLSLRTQQSRTQPEQIEVDRLMQLALRDRFDLTDTLHLTHMLERLGRVDDALDMFERLGKRYPQAVAIRMWHAERLQHYRRWEAAESMYLNILQMMSDRKASSLSGPGGFWRASQRELALAQSDAEIPGTLLDVDAVQVYRRLAENALAAGAAAEGADRQRWLEKSEQYFKTCIDKAPDDYAIRGAYAGLLLQMGRAADSLANYRLLLEQDARNLGWLVSAAMAAAADRQFGPAERYMRETLRIESRPEWRLELARYMSWGGKHEAALTEIEALMQEYPEHAEYQRERAALLLNAGRHREYLSDTAWLAARNPLDLELRLNRVRAMIGLNLYAEAVQEATAMLALAPDHREAALLKAEALLWGGEYRAAQADLRLLAQHRPDDRLVRKRLAQSYLWDKRYLEALEYFRRLDPEALLDLEMAQGFAEAVAGIETPPAGDAERIRSMYAQINSNPETPWPVPLMVALGRALRKTGQADAAVELLRAAAQRARTNLQLRLELADLLQDLGRHEEAARHYRVITTPEYKESPP